jgi:CBS domain-containing protein
MSRYRNERDDDTYGGSRSGRGGGGGGRSGDERYEAPRGDYYGGRSSRYDDDYGRERFEDYGGYDVGPRRRRREEDEETLVRGRQRFDERDAGYGRRAGRRDYEDYARERDEDADEHRGRSLLDEGRDYFRRTFGVGRSARRGASRSHVRCRDIMTRDVTVATRQTMLEEVARMMRDEDAGVIPVVERASEDLTDLAEKRPDVNRVQPNIVGNGKLVGLITDRDLVVRAVAEGKDTRTTRAEEIMTTDIHTAQPNDRVIDAIRKMGDKQVRRIPVVDRDNTLRGIISMADVALETEEDRELADALEEISSGSSFWNRVFG